MGACASSFRRLKDEPLPAAAVKKLASTKEDAKSVEEKLNQNDSKPPAAADGEVNYRSLGFLFEKNTGNASEDVTEKSLSEPVSAESDDNVIKSILTEEKKSEEKKSEEKSSSSEIEKVEENKQDEKEIEEPRLVYDEVKGEIEEIGIEASKLK